MIKYISLILIWSLVSCTSENQNEVVESIPEGENISFLSNFCEYANSIKRDDFKCNEWRISLPFNRVGEDLYSSLDGDLFFLTHDYEFNNHTVFLRLTGFKDKSKSLFNSIDSETWERFGFLYRDKNNLYCHHIMSDGGRLMVLQDFNPQKVVYVDEYDGKDETLLRAIDIAKTHHAYATDGKRSIDIRCGVKLIN